MSADQGEVLAVDIEDRPGALRYAAFTDPACGNPAGVVPDAGQLNEQDGRLCEQASAGASDPDDVKVRYGVTVESCVTIGTA